MGIKGDIRRLAEKLTGLHVYSVLPRGVDLVQDVGKAFPTYRIVTIFDVGANVGQSATAYARALPDAEIFSFEPISATFRRLQENTRGLPRVRCVQLAFGASADEATMVASETSAMNRLVDPTAVDLPTERVQIDTLDRFCATQRIDRIHLLKVDTEGADLEVLKGARSLLGDGKVDLVQVEAGMNGDNKLHVPFAAFQSYLEPLGYRLFGIYDQHPEWTTRQPHLRRTNPVFISRAMVERGRPRDESSQRATSSSTT